MNLAIDIGNTRCKWGLFEKRRLIRFGTGLDFVDSLSLQTGTHIDKALGSCVGNRPALSVEWLNADFYNCLPISIGYRTPQSLGADRVAAACGAWRLSEGQACVVVDAGTCITVDYVDEKGCYKGGAIMPGIRMQLESLHEKTHLLPIVDFERLDDFTGCCGSNTEESMIAGTINATRYAISSMAEHYRQHCRQTRIITTGGDGQLMGIGIFEPHLVLIGLNEIMEFNKQ